MHPVAANSYYSSCSLSIYNTNMLVSLPSHIHKIHWAISGTLRSVSLSQCPFTNSKLLHKFHKVAEPDCGLKGKTIRFRVLKPAFGISTFTVLHCTVVSESLTVRTQVASVADGPQSDLFELKEKNCIRQAQSTYIQAALDVFPN